MPLSISTQDESKRMQSIEVFCDIEYDPGQVFDHTLELRPQLSQSGEYSYRKQGVDGVAVGSLGGS